MKAKIVWLFSIVGVGWKAGEVLFMWGPFDEILYITGHLFFSWFKGMWGLSSLELSFFFFSSAGGCEVYFKRFGDNVKTTLKVKTSKFFIHTYTSIWHFNKQQRMKWNDELLCFPASTSSLTYHYGNNTDCFLIGRRVADSRRLRCADGRSTATRLRLTFIQTSDVPRVWSLLVVRDVLCGVWAHWSACDSRAPAENKNEVESRLFRQKTPCQIRLFGVSQSCKVICHRVHALFSRAEAPLCGSEMKQQPRRMCRKGRLRKRKKKKNWEGSRSASARILLSFDLRLERLTFGRRANLPLCLIGAGETADDSSPTWPTKHKLWM